MTNETLLQCLIGLANLCEHTNPAAAQVLLTLSGSIAENTEEQMAYMARNIAFEFFTKETSDD